MNITISPLDNRYKDKTYVIKDYFSEFAFFKYRLYVELIYFKHLCKLNLKHLQLKNTKFIDTILDNFDYNEYLKIKELEKKIKHDVKSIEYYLREEFKKYNINKFNSFIHFGLTSQDINNTSISISLKNFITKEYSIKLNKIMDLLILKTKAWKNVTMISRTHGQPAVPTSMGKEFNVFLYRLELQFHNLKNIKYYGKFGGASGNLNAHVLAYPNINWNQFGKNFLNQLGLIKSKFTTQIDNYDNLATLFDCLKRINSILIDFCQDIWLYIFMNYLQLKINYDEVGSSTMPQKVNPINFENAEGNLKLANNLFEFFSRKLPISRLQRDLTDSTILRNLGTIFGHCFVAFDNLYIGIQKIDVNLNVINKDLIENYVVIVEGVQTILRKYGKEDAYEKLKDFSRKHKRIGKNEIDSFINSLNVNETIKKELLSITIYNYKGYS